MAICSKYKENLDLLNKINNCEKPLEEKKMLIAESKNKDIYNLTEKEKEIIKNFNSTNKPNSFYNSNYYCFI